MPTLIFPKIFLSICLNENINALSNFHSTVPNVITQFGGEIQEMWPPDFFQYEARNQKMGKILFSVRCQYGFAIFDSIRISHYHHNVDLAGSARYCRNKIGSWEIPFSEFHTLEEKKCNIPSFLQRVVESTSHLFISSYDQPHLICYLA